VDKNSLKKEVIACGRDPVYFIKKYVKIKHPVRGLIPFKMWDFQMDVVRSFFEKRFNVVLKSRQMGLTESAAAYAAWLMNFHRNKNVLCIATKADTAKTLIKRVRTALKTIPGYLAISRIVTDNKLSIELDNGSSIRAITTSQDAGRSEAVSLLIIDEAAHIKGFDELWTGLAPTVSAGGRIIMLSTPNGVGNVFHQTYVDAVRGDNDYAYHKFMWWLHPEHIEGLEEDPENPGWMTSPWFRNETKGKSKRDIAQEYCCDFLSSGDTYVGAETLQKFDKSWVVAPSIIEHFDRGLYIWSSPNPRSRYALSCDASTGQSKDNSGIHVMDLETMMQVAEYRGKLKPDGTGGLIYDLGMRYNKCLAVVENNSAGLAVLENLRERGYPNVYYSRKGEDVGEGVDTGGWVSDDLVPGVYTTPKIRPVILSKLEEYLRCDRATFRSSRLLEELRTFVWTESGKAQASAGNHDDLVMAAALLIWIIDIYLAPNSNIGEMSSAMLRSCSVSRVMNTDIRGASKNPEFVPARAMGAFFTPVDPYTMVINGRGATFDLRELIGPRGRKR
jgi:hypothetical protein